MLRRGSAKPLKISLYASGFPVQNGVALLLGELAKNPARMEVLSEPRRYDPEQVFYIKGLRRGADGLVHFMMKRPEGDGFTIAWDPAIMLHTIRWVLANSDQRVAAFAMPATCEPEGYLAEKRKGKLAPGYEADFILLDRNLLTIRGSLSDGSLISVSGTLTGTKPWRSPCGAPGPPSSPAG